MHRVPEWYLNKGRADSRQIITQIYLYPGNSTRGFMLLRNNDIADYDVVKELQDTGVPCSYLGQSSATIKIYNEEKRFNEDDNKRYIQRGVKVEIAHGYMSDGADPTLFQTRLFTGWIDHFEFDEYAEFVTITAYDSLHFLRTQPSPPFRPSSDKMQPLYEIIECYLRRCGLEPVHTIEQAETIWHMGYQIDKSITAVTRPLLNTGGTIGDVLTQIAQAGICAIYCDAFDVLQVQLLPRTRHLVYTFDDMTQVYSSASSTLGYEDYTHVEINVYDTCANADFTLKRTDAAYSETEMTVPGGESSYNKLSMNNSIFPTVISIISNEYMEMPNNTNYEPAVQGKGPKFYYEMPMLGAYVYLMAYDYAMDGLDITFWGARGTVIDFTVYAYNEGRTVGTVVESADSKYSPSFFLMKKVLTVDCQLISGKYYAQQCANTYSRLIEEGAHKISSSTRGEPALELLDLVAILNPRAVHDNEQVVITRFHYTFDGSMTCDIESLNYSSILLMTFAFISPGFYIPYDAGAVYITARCDPEMAGVVDGTGAYAYGELTRLLVVAAAGWTIDHWEDEDGKVYASGGILVEEVEGPKTYIAKMKMDSVFCSLTVDVPQDDLSVTIPTMSLTPVTPGTIDWGDGTVEPYDPQQEYDHTYPIPGTMEIYLQAPIENMPFAIFLNNQQINTFTFGSDVKYIPQGMFYNSSLKSVNMLAPDTLTIVNSFDMTSGNTQVVAPYFYTYDSGYSSTLSILPYINANNNAYHPPIDIENSTTAVAANGYVMNVPGYYNGLKVRSVHINQNYGSVATNTIAYSITGNIDTLDITGTNRIVEINTHGHTVNLFNHKYATAAATTDAIPAHILNITGIMQFRASKMNISALYADTSIVTLASMSNYPSLTDIYIGQSTEHLAIEYLNSDVAAPGEVNLHVPNTLTDINIRHNKSAINIMTEE